MLTGESDIYEKSEGGQIRKVKNPFEHLTEEQVGILKKNDTLSYQMYILRIISNLFMANKFFTTVAIEYYRRGQPKKVIEFIKNLQSKVPDNKLEYYKDLRQGQILEELFTKNV